MIIWTRVTPEKEGTVRVSWEVASDEGFSDVVASGSGETTASVDYTVKVDVEGLDPGSRYFYRFHTRNRTSTTGRTRTLPVGAVSAVAFAVVSCSNYPAGFFNVYREVAGQDVEAVLHLGDYLYEYPRGGYASNRATEYGRELEPPTELYSLSDYRTRYAQYHGDQDLQAAHAAHPFIAVWDDHEESLDPAIGGDFNAGVAAVLASVQAKNKAPEERTPKEQALLDSALPYNPDAWDGYGFERDAILEQARQLASNLVVLAGNTHNAWTSQLTTPDGQVTGVEFGCASVSSPGLEADNLLGGKDNARLFAPLVTTLVDDLRFTNLFSRGYVYIRFSDSEVTADHRFVTTIESTDYAVDTAEGREFTVSADNLSLG